MDRSGELPAPSVIDANRPLMPRVSPWARLDALARASGVRIALLLFCVSVIAWYVSLALRVEGNNDNDAAYYLGVAKHMVRTGRFEENIVWQFLDRPTSLVHRPFTYWQGLLTLLLVPVLSLFHEPHAPFVFMALVSSCALLLLWHLVTVAAPFSHPVAQAVTLFMFGLSPAMVPYRVDTDTVPLMHLWIAGSLVALATSRWKTAACIGFLMLLSRGDGGVFCAFIWGICLWRAWKAGPSPLRRTMPVLLTCIGLAVLYLSACELLHGRVPSQAAWQAPRLTNYWDLYAFDEPPKLVSWMQRLRLKHVVAAFWTAINNLRSTPLAPVHDAWLALVILLGWRGIRWKWGRTVWLLLFAGSSAIVLLSGPMFSEWRTLYTMLPFVALAAGATVDTLLDWLGRLASGVAGRQFGALSAEIAAGIALLAAASSVMTPLPPPTQQLASLEKDLRALAPTLRGQAVASVRPWSVIAHTDSPAVIIPGNGPEALEGALKLYRVPWLLLSREACVSTTEPVCAKIRDGTQRQLGSLQLTEHTGSGELRLFRVEKRSDDAS